MERKLPARQVTDEILVEKGKPKMVKNTFKREVTRQWRESYQHARYRMRF